ncbi:MAG: HDOD domain-containing protein [Deltaproteobacteria bacterium]|nr:MAG: HDOD domain-containing protein [Deltaproteobacteria bacterium]
MILDGKDDVWEIDLDDDTGNSGELDPAVFKLISEQIEQLPPFPMVINQVLSMIEDPNATLADLAKVILNDPSLTGNILRATNSAYYGFPGKISTVSHAVSLLGLNEVKNLALSLPINDAFFTKNRSFGLDQTDLWVHSLSVGFCVRKIGERVGYPLLEEAFVAGLLHDIGKNLLNDVFPERFDQALHRAEEQQRSLVDIEQELLTISHATIGSWLAQHWKLPDTLTTAIQNHHQPLATISDEDTGIRLEAIIFLADFLAKFLSLGFSGDRYLPRIRPEIFKHLAITSEDVIFMAEGVRKDIQPTLRPFGLEIDLKPLTAEDKTKMAEFFAPLD